MKECWAACLGDCEGGISGEHYVSQGLFTGKSITVSGFPWCKDEPKTVGIGSLTNNMLCRKHNSLLSPLDDAVQLATGTFREAVRLLEIRKRFMFRHRAIKVFRVNGLLLERWFLKTLINVSFGHPECIGLDGNVPGLPSRELVEIVYGRRNFVDSAGLYTLAVIGENITVEERVRVRAILRGGKVTLGMFTLYGYRFLLSLLPELVSDFEGTAPIRHLEKQIFTLPDDRGRAVRSHRIDFDWL